MKFDAEVSVKRRRQPHETQAAGLDELSSLGALTF